MSVAGCGGDPPGGGGDGRDPFEPKGPPPVWLSDNEVDMECKFLYT
jgi:hypothetical protein